ncbi:MAG: bacillithiol biosynthesis deacetylase BshB1 [Bacteroidetes bacterium]|nr:bacillithiol biosynthesis deacetylase BshB1 [Bacteroidota bacterium]
MSEILDILAFAAHPDDIELSCSGTLIKHIEQGFKVGIVDLTEGELGSRGNKEIRKEEADKAAKLMNLSARENLKMPDGFFDLSEANKISIIKMIRKYKPRMVFANAVTDRHPDHGRAAQLVSEASFLSGLIRIDTGQAPHRPETVYHYIQDRFTQPDFIVDITGYFEKKMECVKAFRSQFYNPDSKEILTPISGPEFFDYLQGRAIEYGRLIGKLHGEGFTTERPIGISSLKSLI